MKKIIQLFKVYMSSDAKLSAGEVLDSGYIGQGKIVDEFEFKLKERFKTDYVLTTNSATSAEHLALHLLKKPHIKDNSTWNGIKDGDEVLATPLTCTASNFPIIEEGIKREEVLKDGKYIDSIIMSMLLKEFKKLNQYQNNNKVDE